MMNWLNTDISQLLNLNPIVLAIVLVWTLIWKGLALWKSARKNSPIWFVVLLVINTVGILEILYIFLFSELKMKRKAEDKTVKKKKR